MKTVEEFLKSNGFEIPPADRQTMLAAMLSEMEKGLAGEESSLMMVPAYVGTEGHVKEGDSAAVLDAGGTNFRGALVSIPPKIEDRQNRPMPGSTDAVNREDFYKAFAEEVKRILPKATAKKIGWCFSYPATVTPDLDAQLVRWTKNIKAPEIVGDFVGSELAKRLGGGKVAIVNDTVATLLAAKATEGDKMYSSYIGFILGTGTNCAYVEKRSAILKLPPEISREGTMIINAESGNFNKMPLSEFDKAVDAKSVQPHEGLLEKMIAGAYLGSIGLEIFKAAAKEGMFSPKAAGQIAGLGKLETMDLDNFTAHFVKEGRANPLDAIFATPDDARMARRLALPVFERAAVLTAIHLAAFAIKSGEGEDPSRPIAINADGSTFYKTRAIPFADTVKSELDNMLVKRRNIHYTIIPQIDDAPIVGAAIAAML